MYLICLSCCTHGRPPWIPMRPLLHLNWGQCDQIGRFIRLWPTFQSLWPQLICSNLLHSWAIFVKVSKCLIFLVKSFLGNFYRFLAIFKWSHWLRQTKITDDCFKCFVCFCCFRFRSKRPWLQIHVLTSSAWKIIVWSGLEIRTPASPSSRSTNRILLW